MLTVPNWPETGFWLLKLPYPTIVGKLMGTAQVQTVALMESQKGHTEEALLR
jgi:hypothetical protein